MPRVPISNRTPISNRATIGTGSNEDRMLYEDDDTMVYEDGDIMIYEVGTPVSGARTAVSNRQLIN